MAIESKVTAQGQISVPAEVRKRLGVGPGSVLAWEPRGDQFVVRRVGQYSWDDVHAALFPEGTPRPKTLRELKEGPAKHIRRNYARR